MVKRLLFVLAALFLLGFFGKKAVAQPLLIENRLITLVDPINAPEEIREEVLHGYRILMNTPEEAKGYSGNSLSCRNCHFVGGNTLGGKNGSISLVGMEDAYPAYSERMGRTITLAERITNCFERSLNGQSPPVDSPIMKAIVTYLNWIGTPAEGRKELPWRGLPTLSKEKNPDPEKGERLYEAKCALCHGKEGEGMKMQTSEAPMDIPPLWGKKSFNDGAGMNKPEIFAAFIYQNMPYQNPTLTVEEALDIASFVTGKERPTYAPHNR